MTTLAIALGLVAALGLVIRALCRVKRDTFIHEHCTRDGCWCRGRES